MHSNFSQRREEEINKPSGCGSTNDFRVGGSRSKERDRKSELVLSSTYQILEWDRNFHNVVRYVHIPLFSLNQNWIVVINQRFLKKRFCIHHEPPARAADKKIQPT